MIWNLIIGGVIGWLAGLILGKDIPGGIIGNIIAGLIGSSIGGWLFGKPADGGIAFFPSLIGAIILILVVSFILKRK